MRRRKVYLSWANSILRDAGEEMQDIGEIQQGKILCQLIDNLDSSAGLLNQLQKSGSDTPEQYIHAALDHMRKNGVKVTFCTQDLLDKDVKSMLDALWQIILNYCIHPIERGVFQRSVGIGKKQILDWCQKQLGADFDPRNTIAYNLCTGDWFIKLLQKVTGLSHLPQDDKAEQVIVLLEAADRELSVESSLINASEIVDGTIDEHTLMIYISLLQRKVGGSQIVENGGHSTGIPDRPDQGLTVVTDLDLLRVPNGNADDDHLSAVSGSLSPISGYSPSDSDRKEHYRNWRERSAERKSQSRDRSTTSGYSDHSTDSTDRKRKKYGNPGLQRPRSPRVIMAETKEKIDAEFRKKEREEAERQRQEEMEKRMMAREINMGRDMGGNPGNKTSSDEDIQDMYQRGGQFLGGSSSQGGGPSLGGQPQMLRVGPQFLPGMGVPILVMPGQGPQAMLLMQSLQQARQDANFHDHNKSDSMQQTLPKLHALLDLDGVDEYSPIVETNGADALEYIRDSPSKESQRRNSPGRESPRRESPRRESPRRDSPRRESPRRESPNRNSAGRDSPRKESTRRSESPEFRRSKRGILDVVNDNLGINEDAVDLYDMETEQRRFPRVEITDPLKARIEKDKNSPSRDRSRSRSPRERRSLTPGTSDNEELTDRSQEDESVPRSILRNKLASPDRVGSRLDSTSLPAGTFNRLRPDRSPSYRRRSSPERSNLEPSSMEKSPGYTLSDGDASPRDNSPGHSFKETDPNKRLVRVLNRELELLRLKMDVLERANMSEDTDLENLESVTTQLSEKVKETLSKATSSSRRRQSPESSRRRQSPESSRLGQSHEYERGRMFRKKRTDSPPRSWSATRPSQRNDTPDHTLDSPRSHSVGNNVYEDIDGKMTYSPPRLAKPISLGYSSPIRNVSEEIWGVNLSDLDDNFDPERTQKWKRLASLNNVSDRDVVQLKQGLASAVSELDILQAKLKNADVDIQAKMSKTSDILNDCRSHLAKSQAENMELRTQLEKERTRNDTLENKIRDTETSLSAAKSMNDDLETELDKMRGLLKGASKRDIPSLQSLSEERDGLLDVLANTQKENTALSQNFEQSKKHVRKGQSTINDLRGILDEAIKERCQLYDEIKRLQTEGHLSHVSGIIGKYMEKGLYDMAETQPHLNSFVTRSRSNSDISQHSASDLLEEEALRPVSPTYLHRPTSPANVRKQSPLPYGKRSTSPTSRLYPDSVERVRKLHGVNPVLTNSPNKSSSVHVSGISQLPVTSGDEFDNNFEDVSPSNGREIYPHRRSRSYRNNFSSSEDGRRSPSDYMDDLEVQKLMAQQQQPISRLDFDKDVEDNFLTRAPKKAIRFQRSRSPGRSKSPGVSEHRPVRRQLQYNSPHRNMEGESGNKMYLAKHDGRELIESIIESPVDNRLRSTSPRERSPPARGGHVNVDLNNSNKIFIDALNNAVQNENGRRCFDDFDIQLPKSPRDTRSTLLSSSLGQEKEDSPKTKRVLKSAKGEQNMTLLDSPRGSRSFYSHSASPIRSPRSKSPKTSTVGQPRFGGGTNKRTLRNSSDVFFDEDTLSSIMPYHHKPLRLSEEDKIYADLLIAKYTGHPGYGVHS